MADLIAQGGEEHERWRRPLTVGERVVVGRESGPWSTPWDKSISRQHAELTWRNGRLAVRQLPTGRNPVFVSGREAASFELRPGECFVIGDTTFTLAADQVNVSLQVPQPREEQAFKAGHLRRVRFQNADHRIDVLSRLPEVISGVSDDSDLYVRLVNMLLAGIPRANSAALVAVDLGGGASSRPLSGDTPQPDAPAGQLAGVEVLHWDRRQVTGGDFQPSQRLITEAVRRNETVLHVWGGRAQAREFTLLDNTDWAFCTPVPGEACRGWGVYVAGQFPSEPGSEAGPTDVREDVKFTELVSATLGSLRQLRRLQSKHTTFSQFFAPAVLEAIMAAEDPDAALSPRETDVSVLFCDLRGFSFEAERSADDLLGLLKRVSKALGVMTHHILDQGGVFGDFQGDAAMGFWGWPFSQSDATERACLAAALAIRSEFEAAARRPGHPLADFQMGIGLATGRAVAGRIGTVDQGKVTVFGPVVNLASRLEGMTKLVKAPIVIDEATARFVRTSISPLLARCRRLAKVQPYGLDTSLEVSELLPPEAEHPELTDEHLASYEAALDAFLEGRWKESITLLHKVPPTDLVKDFLMVFIAQRNRTPPAGWDGVIPLPSKG